MFCFRKLFLVYFLAVFQFGNAYILSSSKQIYCPPRAYLENKFNLKYYQTIGYRNITCDFDLNYQFRQIGTVGIGNGLHLNFFPIFSASDKHRLSMLSYPLYFTSSIYLFGNEERAVYLYGHFGKSFQLKTEDVKPDKSLNSTMASLGIGFERIYKSKTYYFELAQYFTNAKGTFFSTYNSTINYNLEIYTLVARIGFKLTR